MLPAAEKTRSTPAEDAGAAKYCLTILASAGHLLSFALRPPEPCGLSGAPAGGGFFFGGILCARVGVQRRGCVAESVTSGSQTTKPLAETSEQRMPIACILRRNSAPRRPNDARHPLSTVTKCGFKQLTTSYLL